MGQQTAHALFLCYLLAVSSWRSQLWLSQQIGERCPHLATHLNLNLTSPSPAPLSPPLTLILTTSPIPLPLTSPLLPRLCIPLISFTQLHRLGRVQAARWVTGKKVHLADVRARCEQRKGSPSHFSNPNGDTWSLTSSKAPPRMTGSVSLAGTMPISSEMSTSSMWFTCAISLSWNEGESTNLQKEIALKRDLHLREFLEISLVELFLEFCQFG